MLNPEKICHEHLTDLSTSPVICIHFTLGNPKKHFSTLLFIYFRLFTLAQQKTSSNCRSAALAVYSLLFSASYYLHSPSTASGARYRRSACIDIDVLGLAAEACCDMGGLNFSTAWCSMRLNSVEKDWEHVLTQKVVTLNTCYDIACRIQSSCHKSQPVLFRATDDNPQLALFRASNVCKNATNLQSDEKVLQFTSWCGDTFRWCGQVVTDCFLVR